MGRIFKNMIPYWKSIVIILLLLIIQAYCDLSLPKYTSAIIDTGIQNSGVEHILPEGITEEDYRMAQMFMTSEEKEVWESCYVKEDDIYRLQIREKERLSELDEQLILPLVIVYQISQMDQEELASAMEPGAPEASAMPNGNMAAGEVPKEVVTSVREQAQGMIDTMGETLLQSTGVAYAVNCDKAAGIDVDTIQKTYLVTSGIRMIVMALIMGVATVLVGFFASRTAAGIGRDLRESVFKKVVGFSNAEIDKFSTASLITRTTNDVQQIQLVTVLLIRMVAYAPILGIGGVIEVIKTGAGMGWVIVLAVLLIAGVVLLLMSLAMPKFKQMQKLVDNVNLISREILTGLPVIRAFKREKHEEERFAEANTALTKTTLFTNRVMTFMMPMMMFIMYGLTVLIVWVASHKIDAGVMQVGAMTAFITYAMMIVMAFLMLTMMSIMLPRAGVSAQRIDEVLKTDSSIANAEDTVRRTEKTGLVRFDHVCFRYPGAEENVLSDIDFTAEPGKTTAIIGSTGSGKSTLVNLLPRLYEVSGGVITLDGVDIRKLKLEDLREGIGYVPQKGILFSGTIASNIRFGAAQASEEEVVQAARIAQAEEFIEGKDSRYESEIAQGGSNVSGGQKQRLSIARAIAKNPDIYIFDDSFSALDLKTDAALRKALAENVADKTVIIVAQRISTILHADQILVLDDGRIAGKGTHEELLKNCDVYMEIAKSQLSEKELGLNAGKEAADE